MPSSLLGVTSGMADATNTAEKSTTSRPSQRPFSAGGIHRRKHTHRAIFRSVSFLLLLGGYAVYNGLSGDDGGVGPKTTAAAAHHRRLQFIDDDHFQSLLQTNQTPRTLQDAASTDNSSSPSCPALETTSPPKAIAYALGTLYMFLALAIVCDEFFVPALEEMSSAHHLNLSMDVAGATLMAAGGSAPELFTSFVGTFQESDIGIGTIVGSAVFNVLFVIGMCTLLSKEVLTLTWWPLFRDSSYYAMGLIVLSILVGVVSAQEVHWWEALLLLALYGGYVLLMAHNRKLYKRLTGKELVLPNEEEQVEGEENGGGHVATANAVENGEAGQINVNDDNGPTSPTSITKTPSATRDFRWPGTFRAGVLKLLLHPESYIEKGGIGIVAKIQGDVDHVFRQIDINGDGSIDREELGKLFVLLGHEISEEDLGEVFQSLDLDGNGTVSL
jgi:Ca2+/Na+ antiporter